MELAIKDIDKIQSNIKIKNYILEEVEMLWNFLDI
jgi:hypothetical protein